ncbi:carbon-nitrogen hydrolase family protein [Thalassotalea psychrophila]|uniref:Carbon-nitrogen hydrolase family protein n=1 Tax=Thalassotalea psychrophila TaxID=3065647 RepID=A0ABY9TTK0_9GAMM|nr:carbon-nitrogen hydrolase family protein [Colwelliaceae bacterium SQ149]
MRVSVLQFATTLSVSDNLNTCLRMIEEASSCAPELMVLPEFCNALSWYEDQDHAWQLALDIDGEFLQKISQQAKKHHCYIVINVSLRRKFPDITVTSLLFSPQGSLILEADKQTLMGHENDFFVRANKHSDVIETEFGQLGIFPCRDGVTCETPRSLALRGAQLFCDSLNSFALDEASLHVPARAPENKVFLASANKVGPLIPIEVLSDVAKATSIPEQFLMGAGESQIVAPNGEILAKAAYNQEGFIYADINLADSNNKCRPDGSDLFNNRRPELYQTIVKPAKQQYCRGGAEQVDIALYQLPINLSEPLQRLINVKQQLAARSEALIVLPELFFLADSVVNDIELARQYSEMAIRDIASILAPNQFVATSLVIGDSHKAVLINEHGLEFSQGQLHQCKRHQWSDLADKLKVYSLPWGKVALLTGDDACYPELAKVAALQGVHALICPVDIQEPWEVDFGLLSRAAENRICVIASSRNKLLEHKQLSGLVANLETDFTIMTPWQHRKFDGYINHPLLTRQQSGFTQTSISPIAASNKLMSANTDLLSDRPWQLSDVLTTKTSTQLTTNNSNTMENK